MGNTTLPGLSAKAWPCRRWHWAVWGLPRWRAICAELAHCHRRMHGSIVSMTVCAYG